MTLQRIPWRKRADLQSTPLDFAGHSSWGIKDPITLGYFELRDEEAFVLDRLDGQATAQSICQAFGDRFRPHTLSTDELERFIGQLVMQGLVVSEAGGYGKILADRGRASQSRRILSKVSSILAIRFRGIDPDRLLGWMLSWLGWLFSPGMLFGSLILVAAAVMLVIVQFETLLQRLPEARAMLTPANLAWLGVLLCIVKVLHELGHGLTCKRFGGECRELGVMLLVFMPTLYCNVTDIWMVRDKWKRIAVSAAGLWVEAVIASVCTLLWWFSAPGLFHTLCLNLMFLCGISTFVFNGNPLLRYDGYFVLADLLEIPNLQQRSASAVRERIANWYCLPSQFSDENSPLHRQWLLVLYGIASMLYRTMLTFVILWSLYQWWRPFGLGIAAQALAVPVVGMLLAAPILSATRFVNDPANRTRINWARFGWRFIITIILIGAVLSVPLPGRVVAGTLLDRGEAQPVYVTLEGTLEQNVQTGDHVEAGQQLARLTNREMQAEILRVEGEVRQHRIRLDHLEKRRVVDPEAAQSIPTVRETLRDFEQQLAQLKQSANRLILKAPVSGTVLPPERTTSSHSPGTLPTWQGLPLDPRNDGSFVRAGTLVCLIGPVESRTALALVSQDDVNLVHVGQRVRLAWNELSGEVATGRIVEIAALDIDMLSRDAITRLRIPVRTTSNGKVRPVGAWYQAQIEVDESTSPVMRGSAGQAKILTRPQSLGYRAWRWLAQTFVF